MLVKLNLDGHRCKPLLYFVPFWALLFIVIPTKAGIQVRKVMDTRLRGYDTKERGWQKTVGRTDSDKCEYDFSLVVI